MLAQRSACWLWLLLACGAWAQTGLVQQYPPIDAHPWEEALLAQSNQARAAQGVAALQFDAQLSIAARHHAAEMAQLGYVSHESPQPATALPDMRVARAGSAVTVIAENVAAVATQSDVAHEAVTGWLASPEHRRALLEPRYSHVGFGVASDGNGQTYIAQVLAYQPLLLRQTQVQAHRLEAYSLDIALELPEAQQVLLLVGRYSAEAQQFAAGVHRVAFQLLPQMLEQQSVQIRAAVAGSQGYILQDDGWLEPAENRWRSGQTGPQQALRIRSVTPQPRSLDVYRVQLHFASLPSASLAVWLASERWHGLQRQGNSLIIDVPRALQQPQLAIGLERPDGNFDIVLRVRLDFSAGTARLLPGS